MIKAKMNQLSNSKNYYQGDSKRVLCVCSAGLLRSPTAAVVLSREFGFNTRACGVTEDYALIPLSEVLLYWADQVVVMEDYMLTHIPEEYKNKTISLNVPDNFEYMNETLQNLILERYNERAMEPT